MGNGSQIRVWADPWVYLSTPLTPIGPPPSRESQELHVSDIILPESNEWNFSAISQHLPLYEDCILQIIPSSFNKNDELIWFPQDLTRPSQATLWLEKLS